MCPDRAPAIVDAFGDGADRQDGRVGRQHGVGRERSQPFEQILLDSKVFHDGLDDQVGVAHRRRQVGFGGHRTTLRSGHLGGLCRCGVEDFGIGIGDGHVEAGRGQHTGDPATHQAGADDGRARETVGRQHAVYPPSRYITWPV